MEESDNSKGYYLFWALFGGALVLALGSSVILAKMDERPELANADPLLTGILKAARIAAWALLAFLSVILVLQSVQSFRHRQ